MASSNVSYSYPYPYNLNVANFVTIKLNQSNFLIWKTQLLGLIESQDMSEFIEGEAAVPEPTIKHVKEDGMVEERVNPAYQAWRKSDRLLRGWITGTLAEEVMGTIIGLQTSKEKICDELAAIGKPIEDHSKVFWLLSGLGQEYESFTTTMMKPPTPSYIDVVALLQSHETMRRKEAIIKETPNAATIMNRANNQGNTQRNPATVMDRRNGQGMNHNDNKAEDDSTKLEIGLDKNGKEKHQLPIINCTTHKINCDNVTSPKLKEKT
ncbi:hypothetical protein EJ110_NYTH39792 [Nymphaea thermarum]|nr:hypothetical protein EJ110_NYTH39792 [Nymphaea thermarum]